MARYTSAGTTKYHEVLSNHALRILRPPYMWVWAESLRRTTELDKASNMRFRKYSKIWFSLVGQVQNNEALGKPMPAFFDCET